MVRFTDGSAYAYDLVPKNTYLGLLQASSKGRYFTFWIKKRYRYSRLS